MIKKSETTEAVFWHIENEGSFDDCRDLLLEAIINHGIVLTFHAHVGKMLARTAAAVDAGPSLYRNAEILGFCKSDISYRMLAANPANIIYCPQSIMIYELANTLGVIHIAFRKSQQAAAVDTLIQGIIAEAFN